ncbi:MAG: tRNA (uridine(34)/cytosine(34)/5-carboxymethylaminomethyluridine(34)-2'-O)-methyltransferase TrmL [Clostridia bacterium]|nr:tRNA (uridine(34)/cytosine(34)/5-carboxymethylaminomethyluridine(34)-2'-O)-methyltransferase TrmL [Clostridia bacterium]
MAVLNIVLVEPEIPQNTGNIARTCACTGARLHIVKPMGFEVTDKNLKRSGLDYWHFLEIFYYENLNDFFEKNKGGSFFYFTTKAQARHSDATYPDNAFLLFGKETKGLPEELLLKNPERCVRIPMMDECRSLNLANSVAIAVYETLRQWDYPDLLCKGELHNYKWSDANNLTTGGIIYE